MKVLIGLEIFVDLCFEFEDIRFVFDDLLLCIFHVLIVLDSFLDLIDFVLDGVQKMSDEIESIIDVVIFAFIEVGEVLADVAMVEEAITYFHLNNFIIYLQN